MMKFRNIFLLIICFALFGFKPSLKKYEKTKTISKEYQVTDNATVSVSNKYGNINITTWDKNKVEITVKVTVKGNNLDKVENKLNDIDIKFDNSKDLVEARTYIESSKSNWSWWSNNNNKVNYKINYFIKMPKTNSIDLHNKYGDIELNELIGKTNIRCDYGNVIADKLLNKTNLIELNYCGGSEFDYINSTNINADYSKITINKCESIKSDTDYTSLIIGSVGSLSFNSDYGNITVSKADKTVGYSDYTQMKFGSINKKIDINTDYGGLRINNLEENFEEVIIDADYSSIKIGTSSNTNFDFDLNLSYAGFHYPQENVTINESSNKTTKKHYQGSFGKSNSGSSVKIKSSYGGVSFKIND